MDELEFKKILETLLFITDEPLNANRIAKICDIKDVKYVEEKLEALKHEYDMNNRALCIMKIASGWQMATRQEYAIWVRKLYHTRLTARLSNASLETLAIIAWKQPITKAEIEAIRGVDSSGPIETLIERKLITAIGRKETLGRPIMYGTTDEFLKQFGFNSLEDLPNLDTIISPQAIENAEKKIRELNQENIIEKEDTETGELFESHNQQEEQKEEEKENQSVPDNQN